MPKIEHLKKHQFKKGQSGNPKGSVKGVAKNPLVLALKEVTIENYRKAIEICMTSSIAELKVILKDPNTPAMQYGVIKCYIKGMVTGDFTTLDRIAERLVGKIPDELNVRSMNLNANASVPVTEETQDKVTEKVKAAMKVLNDEF